MNCPQCGNAVAKDDRFCAKCYALLEPPNLWRRLLSVFRPSAGPRDVKIVKTSTVEKMNIVADVDGQHREYHSLDEVPPELRATIEAARAEALKSGTGTNQTFTVRDASGEDRTYHSLDEMPADVRAMVERALRESGSA